MVKHLAKEERRHQLLQAALATFGEMGYHRTQVSDIIKKADVARGTFYLYFEGKREIFDTLMTELFDQVRQQVQNLPREAADQIPNQLRGNIERVTNLLLDNPHLTKILMNESVGLDPELDARLHKFYAQLLALIRSGLSQGQEMGFVREGNNHVVAVSLLGSLKEIFYQYFLGTEQPTREAIVQELFLFVIHAIAHPKILHQLSPPSLASLREAGQA